jgi:RNA polymerase sigma-70 factor, ECF subfamily
MQDPDAEFTIKKLFNEHFHSLVFISYGIVKDHNQAEDIVQDVFVKVWQNYDRIKHINNLKPYIITAVKNSSFNYLRDCKVKEKWFMETNTIGPNLYHHPEEGQANDIDMSLVYQAVERIPAKWREVFILSKYEGVKYSEIAQKLAISEKTVEKYMSKALNFLRLELKDLLTIVWMIYFFRKL